MGYPFRILMFLVIFLIMSGCGNINEPPGSSNPLDYVDPMIGSVAKTKYYGRTFPGATLPFSLVKPGPDTEMRRNYLHASYITGFSQLHISGTGGNAQSAVLGIMPTTGDL